MFRRLKARAFALVFFLALCGGYCGGGCDRLFAQSGGDLASLPVIKRLDARDVIFKQYSDDVAYGRKIVAARHPVRTSEELAAGLVIYLYLPAQNEELHLIVARCGIPYDTFATINRWQSMPSLNSSNSILLPSMPGIFIPEEPKNDLEKLIASTRGGDPGTPITVRMPNGETGRFRFIPGDSFTPNERSVFLKSNPKDFRFPLQTYRLTSQYGMRRSPISGRNKMHDGLDLAAPLGTPVFAVREGIVGETGSDAVYGKYVIINHANGWSSLYGHLSVIDTKKGASVRQGAMIGKVGNTGLSTGPHLHFELRENGKAHDPGRVLKSK